MEKKTIKKKPIKKEKKQVIEIHIYTHPSYPSYPLLNETGGGKTTFYKQCTCLEKQRSPSLTSAPCPVHLENSPYIVTC